MALKPIPKGEIITDNIVKHIDKRFISAVDLMGMGKVELTIDRVEKHAKLVYQNGNSDDNAILIYFKEKDDKPLKLCKTNISLIILSLGTSKASDWTGKKIKLHVEVVQSFGKSRPAVRVTS